LRQLEDSIQSGEPNDHPENPETIGGFLSGMRQADTLDYPMILRQMLAALLAPSPRNRTSLRDRFMGLVKEGAA